MLVSDILKCESCCLGVHNGSISIGQSKHEQPNIDLIYTCKDIFSHFILLDEVLVEISV